MENYKKLTEEMYQYLDFDKTQEENHSDQIKHFIFKILNCFEKYQIKEKEYVSSTQPIEKLEDITQFQKDSFKWLVVKRESLQREINFYLTNQDLWNKDLDHFLVQLSLQAEFIATFKEHLTPSQKFFMLPSADPFSGAWKYALWHLFKWSLYCFDIYILIFISNYSNNKTLSGLFFTLIQIFLSIPLFFLPFKLYKNFSDKRRKRKQLDAMILTLAFVTSSKELNHELLLKKMEQDYFSHLILWDIEIYKLLRKRSHKCKYFNPD